MYDPMCYSPINQSHAYACIDTSIDLLHAVEYRHLKMVPFGKAGTGAD